MGTGSQMQDKGSAAQDTRITVRQARVQILPPKYFIVFEALMNGIVCFFFRYFVVSE